MTIADIRKLEEDRDGRLNIVHLQKEGSFYHTATYNLRSQLLMNERIMRIGRFDELRRKLRDRKILDKHFKTKQL